MGVGTQRLEVVVHGEQHVGRAHEILGAEPFLQGLDAPALPEERVPAAGAEIGNAQLGQLFQPLDLLPHLGLGPRIGDIERERAVVAQRGARAQLVDDGQRRDLPHRGFHPRPVEFELELPVALLEPVFGQPEVLEPAQEAGREDLLGAVEAVTRQPDHLLFGEPQRTGVVELGAQFALVDLLGQPHRALAIDERERRVDLGVEPPDHLQHQQLVEIGIEQAPDDRVQLPRVVVDPSGDISLGHRASA